MACGDGSGREAAPDTRAKPSGAKRRRAGSAPDQVLGNVLHLRSKAVLTALWSVVQPYLNPWSRIVEAPPIPAVGFLIGAGPAADQISRDGLRPIANRRISVARVARWRCSSGLGLHGCSWGIGDAGWAYLFRHKADGSTGQRSSQRWHSSPLPLGPSKGYSPPPKNTNTELWPTTKRGGGQETI
jgi:hypothetical protein